MKTNMSTDQHTKPANTKMAAPVDDQGVFHNLGPSSSRPLTETIRLFIRFFVEKKSGTVPQHIPIRSISRAQLEALPDNELFFAKLGHSTILIKHYGEYWLIDPVFGERASPLVCIGPKRFHPTPITIEDLPEMDRVLITHNHYDHLDHYSIKRLKHKTRQFYVSKGVDKELLKWGIAPERIKTFDWWQEEHSDHLMIAYTPAQHFSGRGIGDGDRTLWGSWVIASHGKRFFFSGDSGYFAGFKEIGEHYGPFDLTFIETGAYDKDWPDVHMTPEQSAQAHLDVQGKIMVPIHNGTFDLAFHTWQNPLDRVEHAAHRLQIKLSTPLFGEIFTLADQHTKRWWKTL